MGSIHIGGVELLEPDDRLLIAHNAAIENWLTQKGYIRTYTDKDMINGAIRGLFEMLNTAFSTYMRQISSRSLSDYFLFQYEQLMKVIAKHKAGTLSAQEAEWCERLGPSRQIALRFIAERIVLLGDSEDATPGQDVKNVTAHRMFVCAKSMVDMYVLSDQTFLAFPEHTRMSVNRGGTPFLEIKLDAIDPTFGERVRKVQISNEEKKRMSELLEGADIIGDSDARRRHLDPHLQQIIGTDLDHVFHVLWMFAVPFTPPEGQKYPIAFCKQEQLLDGIAAKVGLSREVVDKIIDAFILTKEKMETEAHEVWISDNEYRSFIRPLLRLPHPDQWHITYSSEMVKESLDHFHVMLAFNQAPVEWMPALKPALSALNKEITAKFESHFARLMKHRGFEGRSFRRSIGTGQAKLRIRDGVGEIDYLGFSPSLNLLVVVECKLARWGSNPKDYYNDRCDFVDDDDSYLKQVTRKADWVQENADAVFSAMKSVLPIPRDAAMPDRIAHAIITYYPTPASLFVRSCPCASFAKFFDAFDTAHDWPYKEGILKLNRTAVIA